MCLIPPPLRSAVSTSECSEEGDSVLDECGQECTCVNGRYTNCCRVRPDYAAMTTTEKLRYINTVLLVTTDAHYKPRYEALVATYTSSYETLAHNTDPNTSQFFVWTRYFLLEYENLLREVDCRITIPYWDWTVLPLNPYMSPVFDPTTGFGDSSRESDICVANGQFSYENFVVTPSAGGGCLTRDYRLQMYPTRAIIEQDVLTLPAEEFDEFHQFLQLFIFSNIRCFIGGHMCSPDAANDPLYLLHLAQTDFIFDRWQHVDAARLKVRYAEDTTPLALIPGARVLDYADNQGLPDGTRVCYGHQEFKNHIPASMAFLSDILLEITNDHILEMECAEGVGQDGSGSLGGVRVGINGMEFMKEKCGE